MSQITNPASRRERGHRWRSLPGRPEHSFLAPGPARRNLPVEFVFVPSNPQGSPSGCAFEGESVVTGKNAWPLRIEVLLLGVFRKIQHGAYEAH